MGGDLEDAGARTDADTPVAVVTGGNAGLGKATAEGLARTGMHVVLTSRDVGRGTAAVADVRDASGSDRVEMMQLDLADLDSVRRFADALLAKHSRLDVLVENAGLVQRTRTETVDGFETTFGVNHLGHFLLTQLLLDRLRESTPSRIVIVSSHAHKGARKGLDFDDLMSEQHYSPMGAYSRSKLANLYFTRELARRLEGTGVTVNAVHPGFVASRLGRDGDGGRLADAAMVLGRPFAMSPEKAARNSVYVATAPELADTTGGYFYRSRPAKTAPIARDDEAARRLWALSEELVRS